MTKMNSWPSINVPIVTPMSTSLEAALSDPDRMVFGFLDEINTSPLLGLFKGLMRLALHHTNIPIYLKKVDYTCFE